MSVSLAIPSPTFQSHTSTRELTTHNRRRLRRLSRNPKVRRQHRHAELLHWRFHRGFNQRRVQRADPLSRQQLRVFRLPDRAAGLTELFEGAAVGDQ